MTEGGGRSSHLETLAAQAAGGDAVAFSRVAAELRPLLLRWALVQTGDADDAEDVAQRALLHMHRGLPTFRFGSRIQTWAYSVVRRAAADWRREARRRQARDQRYLVELDTVTAGMEETDPARLAALIRQRVAVLSARQREAFDLVDLQGHTPAEAAQLLGQNPNTVRTHLLRARRALRACILAERPQLVEDR